MRAILEEASVLYWLGGVLAVSALLAARARRIRPAAVAVNAAIRVRGVDPIVADTEPRRHAP